MLKIAKVKHPGSTKLAMYKVTKRSIVTLGFGGRTKGMAKWNSPNPKMNNPSKVVTFIARKLP